MSTKIFYFSGTGNSLHVAREIQNRLSETTLVPMVRLSRLTSQMSVQVGGETIGFVFPQYGGQMPKIVANTVKKLDVRSVQYIFAIVTRGGTPCRVFSGLDKILEKWGKRLDSYFVLTMPSGSDPLVESYAENITADRISRLETELLNRITQIKQIISAQEVHRDEDLSGIEMAPPKFMQPFLPLIKVLEPVLLPLAKTVESNFNFYFDSKCTGCGICEKVCLAQKIKMVAGKPVWQQKVKCHGCFACLNYCPEQAVQIGSTWYLKSCTPQNGRYHHPQITALDIASQK